MSDFPTLRTAYVAELKRRVESAPGSYPWAATRPVEAVVDAMLAEIGRAEADRLKHHYKRGADHLSGNAALKTAAASVGLKTAADVRRVALAGVGV